MKRFAKPEVAAVFNSYPSKLRARIMFLRQLIFEIAAETDGVGELEETLKWGSPSYLTSKSKSGTTIRIDRRKFKTEQYTLSVHCQSTLIDTIKEIYHNKFMYEGNRSIIFNVDDEVPVREISHCIYLALTYHLRKRQGRRNVLG